MLSDTPMMAVVIVAEGEKLKSVASTENEGLRMRAGKARKTRSLSENSCISPYIFITDP